MNGITPLEGDYDVTASYFERGAFLRKLREMEREDEAQRCNDQNSITTNIATGDTLQYDSYLAHQNYYDDYKHVNYRFIDFGEFGGKPLVVEQDRSLGKGGLIWDAAFILGEHVVRETDCWRQACGTTPASIVELGSGTGMTGLMVARAFPETQVHLTDLPLLMPLLEKNCASTSNASVQVLEWGKPVHRHYDVILGADVVASIYDSFALAKTIYDLAHSKTWVYLACRDRLAGSIEQFESYLKQMFQFVERQKADSSNRNPNVWILTARGKYSDQ